MHSITTLIQSAQNSWFKALRKRVQDHGFMLRSNQVWLEGDHLCRAYLAHGLRPRQVVYANTYEATLQTWFRDGSVPHFCLSPRLMQSLGTLASPASVGFVIDLPESPKTLQACNSVVLDRIQDAGNVGSVLRSAAAFGFAQILALQGTAQLWSPKVLRAGMGAHFALKLHQGCTLAEIKSLKGLGTGCVCTSSHSGEDIHHAALPTPAVWFFGNEGQGVNPNLKALADTHIRIAQTGGEESLNVATAAAICLHASTKGQTAVSGTTPSSIKNHLSEQF